MSNILLIFIQGARVKKLDDKVEQKNVRTEIGVWLKHASERVRSRNETVRKNLARQTQRLNRPPENDQPAEPVIPPEETNDGDADEEEENSGSDETSGSGSDSSDSD